MQKSSNRFARVLGGVAMSLALSVMAAPSVIAAPLSSSEQSQAQALGNQLAAAVASARAGSAGHSLEGQQQAVQNALEAAIISSGATPQVVDAAVRIAKATLAGQGVTVDCPPRESAERYCVNEPTALALANVHAAVIAQVEAGVGAIQSLTGPIAINLPATLSGGGGNPTYISAPR